VQQPLGTAGGPQPAGDRGRRPRSQSPCSGRHPFDGAAHRFSG